ncbi:hypothetical protein ACCT09_02065, partial [Rhizobium ruizarguesonis]
MTLLEHVIAQVLICFDDSKIELTTEILIPSGQSRFMIRNYLVKPECDPSPEEICVGGEDYRRQTAPGQQPESLRTHTQCTCRREHRKIKAVLGLTPGLAAKKPDQTGLQAISAPTLLPLGKRVNGFRQTPCQKRARGFIETGEAISRVHFPYSPRRRKRLMRPLTKTKGASLADDATGTKRSPRITVGSTSVQSALAVVIFEGMRFESVASRDASIVCLSSPAVQDRSRSSYRNGW